MGINYKEEVEEPEEIDVIALAVKSPNRSSKKANSKEQGWST